MVGWTNDVISSVISSEAIRDTSSYFEVRVICPICKREVQLTSRAYTLRMDSDSEAYSYRSRMSLDCDPFDLSGHLSTCHTDAEWRRAYFEYNREGR